MSFKLPPNKKLTSPSRRQSLGRGLDTLFSSASKNSTFNTSDSIKISQLGIEQIQPNPQQPRKIFHKEYLTQLAESIKKNGVIQPVIVKKIGSKYEIIAGERRWRAAALAGLHDVPVRVLEKTQTSSFLSLIENLQRQDLNPIELAQAYKTLMQKYNFTQEKLANQLGIPRASLANQLRILHLPQEVQQLILESKLSFAVAKILLQETNINFQKKWAQYFAKNKTGVRAAQTILSQHKLGKVKNKTQPLEDWQSQSLSKIQDIHGFKTSLCFKKKGGELSLRFFSNKELRYLMDILVRQK